MADVGIIGFGGYVPPTRVSRSEIVAANLWSNSALSSFGSSERSVSGWDEDSVTLAVEAARDCLRPQSSGDVSALILGTTTAPQPVRLNAAIVAAALDLPASLPAYDVAGGLRAGTSALRLAFESSSGGGPALCVGSSTQRVLAATTEELTVGHGAAALLVGSGEGVVARLKGMATATVDLADRIPILNGEFDRPVESRWVRDEGYMRTVPALLKQVLSASQTDPSQVEHLCLPEHGLRVASAVAKAAGLSKARLADNLWEGCGDCGPAHALMMLVRALETAEPGEHILIAGFGQGADAFLLLVTDAIREYRKHETGISQSLQRRIPCSYPRYLTLHGLLQIDRGPRAEAIVPASRTASFRHRDFLLSLVGGVCEVCGTAQIPRTRICVNPDCRAWDSQRPKSFRDLGATVMSWTADTLTYSPDPPARYGMVDFDGGGRLMIDFTDIGDEGIEVGARMRFVFRAKFVDQSGTASSYFWKASPCGTNKGQACA